MKDRGDPSTGLSIADIASNCQMPRDAVARLMEQLSNDGKVRAHAGAKHLAFRSVHLLTSNIFSGIQHSRRRTLRVHLIPPLQTPIIPLPFFVNAPRHARLNARQRT